MYIEFIIILINLMCIASFTIKYTCDYFIKLHRKKHLNSKVANIILFFVNLSTSKTSMNASDYLSAIRTGCGPERHQCIFNFTTSPVDCSIDLWERITLPE